MKMCLSACCCQAEMINFRTQSSLGMVVELATWYAASATSYAELFVVNGLVTGKKNYTISFVVRGPCALQLAVVFPIWGFCRAGNVGSRVCLWLTCSP